MSRSGHRFRRTAALLALLASLASGCLSVKEERRDNALQAATYRYHSAIRWGHFDAAQALRHPDQRADFTVPDYSNIRVTAYEVVQPLTKVDENTATQVALIDYVHQDTQVVRRVIDTQRWGWDEETRGWWLLTPLPTLR